MSLLRIVFLAILAGGAGYWYFDHLQEQREAEKRAHEKQVKEEQVRAWQAKLDSKDVDPDAMRAPMIYDNAMMQLSRDHRPAPAAWESAEKERFLSVLKGSFDTLLVPFQVEGYGFDRSTRSLMSAQLAAELRARGVNVPDTYPLLRALGESRRQFKPSEVREIAARLGVKKVIWTYAGHDHKHRLSMTFRTESFTPTPANRMSDATPMRPEGFQNIELSSQNPPIVAYQALLPGFLKKLGYADVAPAAKQNSAYDGSTLPGSPIGMTTEQPDAARDAFYFLAYAALTPKAAERTRERFVEKAFLATQRLAQDHPDYRYLRAREFMLMGLRPAALRELGDATRDEDKALLAMLNGNYPQLNDAALRLKPGLKKILAELDLAEISFYYGFYNNDKIATTLKRLAPRGTAWPFFLSRSLSDFDHWIQFENLPLKELLDAEMPIQGFTARGIVSGAAALADPSKLQASVDFSVHSHLEKIFTRDASKWCCVTDAAHPSMQDYLELIEATGFHNLARRAIFLNDIQGRPEDALAAVGHFETVYKGHPHLQAIRARAESAAAGRAADSAKEGLLRSAYANAFEVFHQEQGQTDDAWYAFRLMKILNRNDFGNVPNIYLEDIPFRAFYSIWPNTDDAVLKIAPLALDNSTIATQPVFDIFNVLTVGQHDYAKAEEFLKSMEGRFGGNTDLDVLRAKNKVNLGKPDDAERIFREAIKSQPTSWEPYEELSRILFRRGNVKESADVAKAYPGFAPRSKEHPVTIAYRASEIGYRFYLTGSFDNAKWFLKISAGLNTGSGASLLSETALKLLAGDLGGALKSTYAQATRYGNEPAYANYLAFLHATGHSKEAWDGFNALVPRLTQPYLWESALVGHRIAGTSEKELLAWGTQDVLRNAGPDLNYPALVLFWSTIVDRVPGESSASLVGKLDRPTWQLDGEGDFTVKVAADGTTYYVLGPWLTKSDALAVGAFETAKKHRIKSDLEYFVEASRLLKSGDFEGGRARLEETASLYDLSKPANIYMLPYLAYAAAKSGNVAAVEKKLTEFPPDKQQQFHYLLARAVLSGMTGKPEDSILQLKQTLGLYPFSQSLIMHTDYEYAELVEWMYESTKDGRFRDLALEWARKNQKIHPWRSWTYAVDAKLSSAGPERNRAIAMAYYLDRNSERLKSVPKREIEKAIKEFQSRNPFLNMREPREKKPIQRLIR